MGRGTKSFVVDFRALEMLVKGSVGDPLLAHVMTVITGVLHAARLG